MVDNKVLKRHERVGKIGCLILVYSFFIPCHSLIVSEESVNRHNKNLEIHTNIKH